MLSFDYCLFTIIACFGLCVCVFNFLLEKLPKRKLNEGLTYEKPNFVLIFFVNVTSIYQYDIRLTFNVALLHLFVG